MKILVTGGAGFIGFHAAKALIERGDEVVVADNLSEYYDVQLKKDRLKQIESRVKFYQVDLADFESLKKVFLENKFDKVCHLAAQAGVRYSIENPFAYEKANNLGTLNVLELMREFGVKDLVFASSSSVYGGNKKIPFSVEDNVDSPISLYAATKKHNELMAHVYHKLYGFNCFGLRFFTCFSRDTNVLTPNGLKNIKDFKVGDGVYTLNPKTKEMEISKVIATQHKKYNGDMVLFNLPTITWEVTLDHNIFVKTDKGFWHFYRAEKFLKLKSRYGLAHNKPLELKFNQNEISLWNYIDKEHTVVIKTKNNKTQKNLNELGLKFNWGARYYEVNKSFISNPEDFEKKYNCQILVKDHHYISFPKPYKFEIKAFVQILGWYISEGNLRSGKYSQITINQRDQKNREDIIEVVRRLKLRPIVEKKAISFMSRLVENYLLHHGLKGSRNKMIPKEIFKMNHSLRKLLWITLMKGDGDKTLKKYTTISEKLAEDMHHLSISCGIRTRITKEGNFYRIRFSLKKPNPCIKPHKVKPQKVKNKDVYCITTDKNHIIFAGKGYNLGWIGQCYGPWGRPDMALFKFTKAILAGKPIDVYNYGRMKRDFTFITDIVDGVLKAIDKVEGFEIFNLGNSSAVELNYFIECVEKELGKKAIRNLMPMQPGDVPETFADIEKSKGLLGFEPKIKIEEGVREFVKWYKDYFGIN